MKCHFLHGGVDTCKEHNFSLPKMKSVQNIGSVLLGTTQQASFG